MKQLADYHIDDQLPGREWCPSHLQLRQYAEASGDFNPIHLDESYAGQAGLGGVVAPGMLTMAQVGVMLTNWIGNRGFLTKFEVRFENVVRPGDRIICSGSVKEKSADSLTCYLQATNNGQHRVLSGWAVISLKR